MAVRLPGPRRRRGGPARQRPLPARAFARRPGRARRGPGGASGDRGRSVGRSRVGAPNGAADPPPRPIMIPAMSSADTLLSAETIAVSFLLNALIIAFVLYQLKRRRP